MSIRRYGSEDSTALQASIFLFPGQWKPGAGATFSHDLASFSELQQPAARITAVMVNGIMSYGADRRVTRRFLRRASHSINQEQT